MPKYYCDYCDIFLTHDSSSVRKAHNTGWKHINQVAAYYRDLDAAQTQEIIDNITLAHDGHLPPVRPLSPLAPPRYDDSRDDGGARYRRNDNDRYNSSGGGRGYAGGRSESSRSSYHGGGRQHPYGEGMPGPGPVPPIHAMSMMMANGGGPPPMPPPPPHLVGSMRHPPPPPPPHMHQYSSSEWSRGGDRQ
ncbi:U1 small nuclear ribonucleoprotein C [Coemansia aciculifera]|nr:U1 small nuclear ribonucleoprotein C [Coemansia aciculifera]